MLGLSGKHVTADNPQAVETLNSKSVEDPELNSGGAA